MTGTRAAHLANRSVFRLSGADRYSFMQNLVSNDVEKARNRDAVYAALLTPQGKFLHDMFIISNEDALLIECETERMEDLMHRLNAYKLRSKITVESLKEKLDVWAIWGGSSDQRDVFSDPRLSALGTRIYIEKGKKLNEATSVDYKLYDEHRLSLGVADGSRDIEIEKSTIVEANFDFLNGVDWKKGCYVGQELTARMHYRALVKKRLFPVKIDGPPPAPNALFADNAGEMRSHSGTLGLALLRLDLVHEKVGQKKPLICGETSVWPLIPLWMKIDATTTNR